MQVEAIYSQGRLAFVQPIHLRRGVFNVIVDIPDAELLLSDSTNPPLIAFHPRKHHVLERIDAILAPYQNVLSNKPKRAFMPKDYKDMWHEHLEEKYLGKR